MPTDMLLWYNRDTTNQINSQGDAINIPWLDTRKVLLMQLHDTPQLSFFKVCTKCGESKFLSEFPVQKYRVNGEVREKRRSLCAQCYRDYQSAWAREKTISRRSVVPSSKVCPKCGIEKSSEEFGKCRRRLDGLQYYCKECRKPINEKWQRENRPLCNAHGLQWRRRYPDRANAITNRRRTRLAGGSYTAAEWSELCAKYNYRCLACGAEGPLTVDHVIPVSKGGSSDISNLQPLCMACNTRKRARVIDYRVGRP